MDQRISYITLESPQATEQFAHDLAIQLDAGDTVLLSGQIGVGKTHFARAAILSMLPEPEDVPSPTYTLVQTYEGRQVEIWHADLYRLIDPSEIIELGLIDAFSSALCLVEWPERLKDFEPKNALGLAFEVGDHEDQRTVAMSWSDSRWDEKVTGFQDD